MIQRIQSLFLVLVTAVSLFLFKGGYLIFTENSGSEIKILFSGIVRNTGGKESQLLQMAYPYSVLVILIPLISLIALFLYKNRKMQLVLVLIVAALDFFLIALSIYYYRFVSSTYNSSFDPGFMLIIPILMLLFTGLAYRGIKKDDQLVKSYDRLR
jgi:hypothetical protein